MTGGDERRTCTAITRKGGPCKKKAMSGADVCWHHSFGKRAPWYKNLTTHAVAVFLTLVGILVGLISDRSSNQTLSDKIDQLYETSTDRLIGKYPEGFILFGVDRTSLVTGKMSKVSKQYQIDWSNAGVTKYDDSSVTISLPSISTKDRQSRGNTGKYILTDHTPSVLPYPFQFFPHFVAVEILQRDSRGVVFVIGFVDWEDMDRVLSE